MPRTTRPDSRIAAGRGPATDRNTTRRHRMPSDALRSRLRGMLPPQAFVEGEELASRPAGFMRTTTVEAGLLVRPASTEELAAVLRECHAHRQPVVTQGGMTGLVHATDTTPADLVVSTERMRRIEEID